MASTLKGMNECKKIKNKTKDELRKPANNLDPNKSEKAYLSGI
jgi:hypothetical protein